MTGGASAWLAGKLPLLPAAMALVIAIAMPPGLAGAASVALAPEAAGAPRVPAFTVLDGTPVAPARLLGKTTVVAFFSSTCPFCMNEAPKLQKLYRDNKQVLNVVAVNIEAGDPEQAAKAAAWVVKYRLTHPVTLDYRAFEAALGKPKGIPALYIFDRQGKLSRKEVGEMLDEDFDDIAREARKP